MNRAARWLPMLLLTVQIAGFALMTKTLLFPALALAAAIAGWSRRILFNPRPDTRRRFYLALAVAMLLKWAVLPAELPGRSHAIGLNFEDSHALAQALLLLQLLWLFVPPPPQVTPALRRENWTPLLGVAVLYLSANYMGDEPEHRAMLILALAYAPLLPLHQFHTRKLPATSGLRMRRILTFTVLALALLAGLVCSASLYQNRNTLDTAFASLLYQWSSGNSAGLSNRASLDTILIQKSNQARTVLVRVESQHQPAYLRSAAFDNFDGTTWTRKPAAEIPLGAQSETPGPLRQWSDPGRATYTLGGKELSGSPVFLLYPTPDLRGKILTRLDTVWIEAPASNQYRADKMRVVLPQDNLSQPYALLDGLPSPDTPSPEYLATPNNLDLRIIALAETLFQHAQTPREKINAALKYFLPYTYQLGIQVPGKQHPLTYFLLEKAPAHCEYFASGLALLLRLGGVPSRYVTGLHVDESNPAGGYWLGRNGDAHAWVEAWTPETGWQTLDATPGGPDAGSHPPMGLSGQYFDLLKMNLFKGMGLLRAWCAQHLQPRALLQTLYATWPGRILLLALLLALVAWHHSKRRSAPPRQADAALREHHRLLHAMDRLAKKQGWARAPGETLHHFARRMESAPENRDWNARAAQWYRAYAEARYQTRDNAALEPLRASLAALTRNE